MIQGQVQKGETIKFVDSGFDSIESSEQEVFWRGKHKFGAGRCGILRDGYAHIACRMEPHVLCSLYILMRYSAFLLFNKFICCLLGHWVLIPRHLPLAPPPPDLPLAFTDPLSRDSSFARISCHSDCSLTSTPLDVDLRVLAGQNSLALGLYFTSVTSSHATTKAMTSLRSMFSWSSAFVCATIYAALYLCVGILIVKAATFLAIASPGSRAHHGPKAHLAKAQSATASGGLFATRLVGHVLGRAFELSPISDWLGSSAQANCSC